MLLAMLGAPMLSAEALQMQAQIISNPSLLNRYYTAFAEGKLSPAQGDAFKQLLAAANRQQQQQGALVFFVGFKSCRLGRWQSFSVQTPQSISPKARASACEEC